MCIRGTPLEGVRRWNTGRMAVRSAAARIRGIHSFRRSGRRGHFAYSFRRGKEEAIVMGSAGRHHSCSRIRSDCQVEEGTALQQLADDGVADEEA